MIKKTKAQVRKEIRTKGSWKGTVVPCKMNPRSPWYSGSVFTFTREQDFDVFVRDFEIMNCINTETGKYAAFYQH